MNDMSARPLTEFDYRLAVLDKMVEMKPILDKAFKYSHEGHTFKDAFDMVATGRGLFFWENKSCAVLEWRNYPSGKTCHLLWAAGKFEDLLKLYEIVAHFAKENGAISMTTLGRRGFIKLLPKEGWEISGVWFIKKLEELP